LLLEYITQAMHKAKYEIIDDEKIFYGEIPGFKGVYSNAPTLEECRDQLEEVLEEWILFRISRKLSLPVVNKIELKVKKVA